MINIQMRYLCGNRSVRDGPDAVIRRPDGIADMQAGQLLTESG